MDADSPIASGTSLRSPTCAEWRRAHLDNAHSEPSQGRESAAEVSREGAEAAVPTGEMVAAPVVQEMVCLDDIQVESIDWLWPSRIAIGKITVLAGDPGLGKSTLSLCIAALVSRGLPWPDRPSDENTPGSVVLLSGEDGLADTTKPRLLASNAAMKKIHAITTVQKPNGKCGPFSLQTDIPRLEASLAALGDARLVIIDPVSCYLGETDDNKNGAVRGLLAPLAELANRRRVAVLLVTHLNKSAGGKSAYRLMGSLAFGAAARAVWMIARDPQDQDRVLMLQSKNNLAPRTAALAYRIKEGKLEWEADTIDMTADDLLSAEADEDRPTSEVNRAAAFLRELLAAGPIPANEVLERAKDQGFSERTATRAKKVARVKSRRVPKEDGSGDEWRWSLTALTQSQDGLIP